MCLVECIDLVGLVVVVSVDCYVIKDMMVIECIGKLLIIECG